MLTLFECAIIPFNACTPQQKRRFFVIAVELYTPLRLVKNNDTCILLKFYNKVS